MVRFVPNLRRQQSSKIQNVLFACIILTFHWNMILFRKTYQQKVRMRNYRSGSYCCPPCLKQISHFLRKNYTQAFRSLKMGLLYCLETSGTIAQWRGATIQKNGDINFTAAKAQSFARHKIGVGVEPEIKFVSPACPDSKCSPSHNELGSLARLFHDPIITKNRVRGRMRPTKHLLL